jgi:hypothetical protein
MRVLVTCFVLCCLPLSGCEFLNRNKGKDNVNPPREQFSSTPTAENLVGYLNKHADQLSVIESSDVDLIAYVQKTRMPKLVGFMVCEKPRSFRLTGDVAGAQHVDIGSNGEQFWFWVKDGESPLYYCSYTDYERGVKLPLPFQPEWVVQALGMAKYDPAKQYRVEVKKGTFELIENTTVQGLEVKKITIFSAGQINDDQPRVVGHLILDSKSGKTICQATIRRQRTATYKTAEGEARVSYPSDVLLEWPSEQLRMELKIGKATVNKRITNQEASQYFTLPKWPGIKAVDLARGVPSGSPTGRDVRQAGGFR